MLQIMSSPHSKEQAAWATQTISTEEDVARHTVPDCRGRTTDKRVKDGGNGRKKREHFVKLTLRNENHAITLPVFKHILRELLPRGRGFTNYSKT